MSHIVWGFVVHVMLWLPVPCGLAALLWYLSRRFSWVAPATPFNTNNPLTWPLGLILGDMALGGICVGVGSTLIGTAFATVLSLVAWFLLSPILAKNYEKRLALRG